MRKRERLRGSRGVLQSPGGNAEWAGRNSLTRS